MTEEFVNKKWKQRYEKLIEFKRQNGHCHVSQRNKEHKTLGVWVGRQRMLQNQNKLRLDRKRLLDDIGFAWKADSDTTFKPDDKLWHQQFETLVEFQRQNGHCVVPFNYQQDKSLGQWVSRQRTYHANHKIRLDRKGRLDDIGFTWKDDGWQHQPCEQLAESGQIMAARTTGRGNATIRNRSGKKAVETSGSSVEETDCRLHEEDSKPSTVKSSSALIGLDPPGQEVVVPEEATTTPGEIPFWLDTCQAGTGLLVINSHILNQDNTYYHYIY
jgi:hypothetical protein